MNDHLEIFLLFQPQHRPVFGFNCNSNVIKLKASVTYNSLTYILPSTVVYYHHHYHPLQNWKTNIQNVKSQLNYVFELHS